MLVQNHVILLQRLKVKSVQELVGLQMCSAVIGIVHVSINGIGCYDSYGNRREGALYIYIINGQEYVCLFVSVKNNYSAYTL